MIDPTQSNTAAQPLSIEQKLEDTRRRLLDLTRRNRLLNHRSKGRATLRVIDELPAEVFRRLVAEEQTLQFLAREEAPREAAAMVEAVVAREVEWDRSNDASHDYDVFAGLDLAPIDAGNGSQARHTDKNLQTALSGDQLQSQLLYLAREAASAREEQGCNILYLSLGIVEWRETTRDGVSRAPLLFVPVDLQRRSVRTRHSLRRYEDDILINPCLVELCRRIFRFELPTVEPDESLDVTAYFAAVETALASVPGWRLVPELHLGLFSFAKLLMYRDLDPANWPAHKQIATHPFVRRLSGIPAEIPGDDQPLPDVATLDEMVPPVDSFQVVDADSSQQVAILAARNGMSAVIEGPPGTGKSQTITNIIAECLTAGKTVLFVAEKSAALSVVKRRLEAAGLGDFVLELHSNKTSKRTVLEELQRTLAAYEEPLVVGTANPGPLEAARSQLNVYVRELHAPLDPLGISPYEAGARVIAARDAPESECQIADPLAWTEAQLHSALDTLDAYDRWRAHVGDIAAHPWRALTLTVYDTSTRQRIQRSLHALLAALQRLDQTLGQAAEQLQITLPPGVAAAETALGAARQILALPDLTAGMLADDRWEHDATAIETWLTAGSERMRRKAIWSQYVGSAAEQVDWAPIHERRRAHSESLAHKAMPAGFEDGLMRWVSAPWKADAQQIDQHLLPGVTLTAIQQLELLQALVESAELRATALAGVKQYATRFRSHWTNVDGDWDALRQVMRGVLQARQLIAADAIRATVAERILERGERATYEALFVGADQAIAHTMQTWRDWLAAIEADERTWLDGDWRETPIATLLLRHEPLVDALEQLDDWVQYQRVRAACVSGPLQSFMAWAEGPAAQAAHGRLAQSFARQFYQLWLDQALRRRPSLAGFRGDDHDVLIRRFCEADVRWLEHNRRRVAERIRARVPDLNREAHQHSKLGILKGEMRKKRRHMALRKLFAQTGDVIQAIKPCFMMSPISIAQYLAPGAIEFDVVIFDEASQVEPADAYGAIARGGQLLLVGDEKQLPPTNFFTKLEVEDAPSEDDSLAATDLESVLSLGVVRLKHQCALRWHYRSRHASLIDFSNQQFYDGRLRVFPGPYAGNGEFGLSFCFVEGAVYMRGAGQHNPVEARTVAQAALRHAIEAPHLSLGVGAFSVAQQRAIEDEIEHLRRASADPRVEAFFAAHANERFFVKNLETIQGDERDVILLSVGYGPDQQGKIGLNFGPLNRDGGWRRLNVLVTRARQRCVLFSSMRADHLTIGPNTPRGVVALKAYLHLAEHGGQADTMSDASAPDTAIMTAIGQALRARGWDTHARVGTVGSFVDLAVVDPDRPGRYLLGIEGDGTTYAGTPTARDRDRLRRQVLEDLGWVVHRVWSLDWYSRPETTLKHLLARLEAIGDQSPRLSATGATIKLDTGMLPEYLADEQSVQPTTTPPVPEPRNNDMSVSDGAALPYQTSALRRTTAPLPLWQTLPTVVAQYIAQLVADELPIHEEEAQRVLAAYTGTRVSKSVREAFEEGLRLAVARNLVRRSGEFLWTRELGRPSVRIRGDDSPVAKPELIAPEEFQEAVRLTLARDFGLYEDALVISVSRLLGFRRCGAKLEAAIREAIAHLLRDGDIVCDGQGFLVLRQL